MSQTPIRTVGRMVDIIELFDHTTPTRDIRDLVEASGLPKSTVVRLAGDLVSRGVLSVDSRGRYSIGATLLRWTLLAERMWRVDEATHEVLRDLVRDLGETATQPRRRDAVLLKHCGRAGDHSGAQTRHRTITVGPKAQQSLAERRLRHIISCAEW